MTGTAPVNSVPTRRDPVVAALSEVVGGPLGPHAGHHRWWSPQRVVLATTAVALAAGMTSKAGCASSSWSDSTRSHAHLCWTELAGVAATSGSAPWPVSHLTRLTERLAAPLPGGDVLAGVAVLGILLAALALLASLLLVRTDRQRPWTAAGWAAGPVLAVHWLSWDLVAAAGVAVILWAWSRRDRGGPFLLAMAVGGLVLLAFAHPLVTTVVPDTGSVWLVLEQATGSVPGRALRLVVLATLVALAAALARVVVRRHGADGVTTLARTTLVPAAALLLLAPSAPPEAALLLLPLAALADLGWRDLLVWQGCELVSWAITGWYLAGLLAPSDGGDARAYWVAVLVRTAGLVWLALAALRARST